jgi:hypothetical protein
MRSKNEMPSRQRSLALTIANASIGMTIAIALVAHSIFNTSLSPLRTRFKTMSMDTLADAFYDELRDILSAERQLAKALPKMAKNATNPELKKAFRDTPCRDRSSSRTS